MHQENNKKSKLAILTSHVIQYQAPFFKELAKNPRVDLTVLFCSKRGAEEYRDKEFGVQVKWDRELLTGHKHKFFQNFFGLAGEIAKEKYDAIVISGYGYFTLWFAWFCAVLSHTPVIFRGETNLLRLGKQSGLKRKVKETLLKIFFGKCSAFLPIGALNREYYKYFSVGDEKLFFCPYAVDNEFFMNQMKLLKSKRDEIKDSYGISRGKVAILFCGKFLPKKRPIDLLAAYDRMQKRNDCLLVFAGDGPLKDEMVKFVKDHGLNDVHFLGFLNQTEIGKAYSTADIFVFPSDFEPFGLALNEAMCFGLPVVVSSEISAAYDLVKDNGFMYPAGDVGKLAEYLDQLVEDRELRKNMGKRSLEIISDWNYEKDVEGIVKALEYLDKRRLLQSPASALSEVEGATSQ